MASMVSSEYLVGDTNDIQQWWTVDNDGNWNNNNWNISNSTDNDVQDKMIKVMKLLSACIRHISNKAYIQCPDELEEAEKLLQELETKWFFLSPNWYDDYQKEKEKEEIVLDEDLFDI